MPATPVCSVRRRVVDPSRTSFHNHHELAPIIEPAPLGAERPAVTVYAACVFCAEVDQLGAWASAIAAREGDSG